MKKAFRFLGIKEEKKELTEQEKEKIMLKELRDKYNLNLRPGLHNGVELVIMNSVFLLSPELHVCGIYEKRVLDGEVLQNVKFFKQKTGIPSEEFKVNSLEDAVKYVSNRFSEEQKIKEELRVIKEDLIAKELEENKIKYKEIERIKALPELKF
jgi:hypothetical protein